MYTIEELEQEAIRRYGNDWRNVKIKEHACGTEWPWHGLNIGRFVPRVLSRYNVYSVNGVLYDENKKKWAEPLFEDMQKNIHTDIQSLKDKYPQFNITVSVEERKDG